MTLPRGHEAPSNANPARTGGEEAGDIARSHRWRELPAWPRRTLIRLQLRLESVSDWLFRCWETERDGGSLFNLAPVFVGLGILAYFTAPAEPLAWLPSLSALASLLISAKMHSHTALRLAATAAALFFLGMSAAQWRTAFNDTPVIGGQLRTQVSGIVLDIDRNSRGRPRYTIKPEQIDGLSRAELPHKIRLSAGAAHEEAAPGNRISGLANLQGFSGPAIPGGYDFGFFNWFDGLGGTGFFMGAPQTGPENEQTPQTFQNWALVTLAAARVAIGERVRAGLPGEPGDIAVALITGDRTGIDAQTSENLRKSGLAHILAISGLHMALVTLTVIGALRFGFALLPDFPLRFPTRKWAAGAGFAAATIYLALSGAGIATQRAWIMIAVMLTATLLDRRALTMRNVAIAAIIILFIAPESLLAPGFQMSFAAVAALVAAYEGWNNWRRGRAGRKEVSGLAGRLLFQLPAWVGSIAFTSLVAGLATALFAAWHFHRIAPLGLLANLAAMPIVSLAVMPLALISVLLMPYGFEQATLGSLGYSIDWVVAISGYVAGFDAGGNVGVLKPAVFAAGTAGLILLTAFRSPLRFSGVLAIGAIAFLWQPPKPPDVLISQDGWAVAVANANGGIELLYPRRNRFVSDIWLRAWPQTSQSSSRSGLPMPPRNPSWDCNQDHCAARLVSGHVLEIVYDPDLLDTACLTADILVAPRLRWVNCRKGRNATLILKRGDFERHGTHAIQVVAQAARRERISTFLVETANGQHKRPWNAVRLSAIEAADKRWHERWSRRQHATGTARENNAPR